MAWVVPSADKSFATLNDILTNGNNAGGIDIIANGSEMYCDTLRTTQIESLVAPIFDTIQVLADFNMSESDITNCGNLGFVQANGGVVDACKEVKAQIGGNLNLNCDGGGTIQFTTNSGIRGSVDFAGNWNFATFPNVSGIPSSSNQLVNKAYVDSIGGSTGPTGPTGPTGSAGSTGPTGPSITFVKDNTEWWVSGNGSDITGDGSILNPYQTIQKAITVAEALPTSSANMGIIYVAPGQYTENLTITKGYLTIQGADTLPVPTGTIKLNGNISIAIVGSDDLFGRQFNLSGFDITGTITDTSTAQHSISLKNIYSSANGVRNLYINSTATNARTYIVNCFFSQNGSATVPMIECNLGWILIENSNLSTSSNTNCLLISGSALAVRVAFNTFENSNNSTSLASCVRITSSSISYHNFGGNTFTFTTLALRNTSPNTSGILFSTGSVNPNAVIAQNIFSLLGTTDSGGANHVIMKDASMTGNVSIFQMGNYAFAGATKIVNTITQAAASIVN